MLYIGMPQIDVVGAINFVKFEVRFPFANLGSKASSARCPISCVSAPDVELPCALTVNWKLGFNLPYLVQDRILFRFLSEGDVHQIFTAAPQRIPATTEDTKTQGTTRRTVKRSRADSRHETKPLGQQTDHHQPPRDGQIMDPETSSMTKGSTKLGCRWACYYPSYHGQARKVMKCERCEVWNTDAKRNSQLFSGESPSDCLRG